MSVSLRESAGTFLSCNYHKKHRIAVLFVCGLRLPLFARYI